MKCSSKKKVILIAIAFLCVIAATFLSTDNLINQNYSDDHRIVEFEESINGLKVSGIYTNLTIDGLPGSLNNWAWAESQVWCSGSGSLLDPYIIEVQLLNMSMLADGLKISNSHDKHFVVRNCTFTWDGVTNSILMTGIHLLNTTHGLIEDNLIYHLGYGILLEDCESVKITGNTIYDHVEGITLDNVNNSRLINNNCSDMDYGIYLKSGSMNNTISGNTANNNGDYGIYIYQFSNYNTISNNIANGNEYSGISLEYECYYNTVSGNIVNNTTGSGIYVYDSCGHNTFSNNYVNNNTEVGISLHWYSSNNTIIDNIANYNADIGIELYDYCENNAVSKNILSYNGLNGIGIYDFSDSNTITYNLLYNNTIGFYIDDGNNNTIYRNIFSKNGEHAIDNGIDNAWNSTIVGNYWDNHTGLDFSPVDGIVDNPYTYIGGSPGNVDYLPLAEDGAPVITIQSPKEDGRYGDTAPTFSIIASDVYVVSMWYTLDDGLHNYTFTGLAGTFSQSAWDNISDGAITITFYAVDIAGNIGTAEVTIGKNLPEKFDPTLVIVIVIGSIALLGVILVILVKKDIISIEKIKGLSLKRK